MAPPAHMVISAVAASRRSSSCRAVVSGRAQWDPAHRLHPAGDPDADRVRRDGCTPASTPPRLPTGVRTASTITALAMVHPRILVI
jgi:hypothetical protein